MSGSWPRTPLRRGYQSLIRRAREVNGAALGRSAMIFAPHQDDETLGCGGTIIKKRAAGAPVQIVFMTDGSRSHRLLGETELRDLRATEALAAARSLGVAEEDVIFLAFRDGRLHETQEAAARRSEELLARHRPDEVFIPYHGDVTPDHIATNRILRSALRSYGHTVVVYEYPVWFWRYWPWTAVPQRTPRAALAALRAAVLTPLRLLLEFRWSVNIADVLERKRAALAEHRSQMTRLSGDPRWHTLADIAGGEFLECFFQEREIFMCYKVPAGV